MTTDSGFMSRRKNPALWLTKALGVLVLAPTVAMAQGPGTEGGNWTYLGGDAWHTRYTPSTQITAANFNDLEIAWQWNASSFGSSTPRATPTYVNGMLITVTGDRRHVVALDPARPFSPRRRLASRSRRRIAVLGAGNDRAEQAKQGEGGCHGGTSGPARQDLNLGPSE